MRVALAVLVVFILLVLSELWWRKKQIHGEFSRKLVHITVGSFVAFWPFFLSWDQIKILSALFLVGVGISKYFRLFKAIHSVQRPTWGELFFAVAVGALAFMTHDKWIYAASLLQMSLADGLAAVVGVRFGQAQSYLVFGHRKSIIGTLTFFVTSLLILMGFNYWTSAELGWGTLLAASAGASIIENIAVRGLDNLLVPLVIAVVLINS